MDLETLRMVVDELNSALVGSRIDKVLSAGCKGIALQLHAGSHRRTLLLDPDRMRPRLHLLSQRPASARASAPFALLLRKHLTGSRLSGLSLLRDDRIVELAFARPGGGARLIFELTGGGSNLVLADGESTVLAALVPAPPDPAGGRALLPGLRYEPPASRLAPRRDRTELAVLLETISPEGDVPRNRAAEAWFARRLAAERHGAVRNRIRTELRRARAKIERRITAVQGDLEVAEKADDLRRQGELVLAHLRLLQRGMESCELPDGEGNTITVLLDRRRTPAENAELLFRRYKKAKAGLALLQERLRDAQDEENLVRSLLDRLETTDDDGLDALEEQVRKNGYGGGAGPRREKGPSAQAPFRTVHHREWEILIGRSAAGNDYITLSLARPEDLWFHAEGMPGSHVLVRNPRKAEVPPAVIERAASLAAYYSKGKGATKVPVAYTEAKYVRKPKGARPGSVVLRERRSCMAVPRSDSQSAPDAP